MRMGRAAPRVPLAKGHRHEEVPPDEMSDEDELGITGLMFPFLECPDAQLRKPRKALVLHLAARYVSHGQVVP